MQKKHSMTEITPIKETKIQNGRLIHLRAIPNCIQPFINSLEKPPKIICKCVDHISLNQLTSEGNRPIKILSTANLLTFIEYDLPDFILPLSSLELLKTVNIYAYNSIQNLIILHNLCVMPDIFFKELNDGDLYTNYNNTVTFINEYFNQQREMLDLEFPPKEPESTYKNIIDSIDLQNLLENEIMEIKNLSKTNEIVLDFHVHEKILQDLCRETPTSSNYTHLKLQDDTSEEYKFVNLFKITFLNTDKLLCVNIQHFNQLKFKCGIHNEPLFLNEQVYEKFSDKSTVKVFVPLKVVFRENNLLFTEVLDINEDVGSILLKRISSGDRILCDLEYSTIPFDMSLFGNVPHTEGESIQEELIEASDSGTENSNTETENTETENTETEDSDSFTETQINPIVKLPDNFDFRIPLKLHLNCQIPLKDTLLYGKVVEILEEANPYDVLLADLKIQTDNCRYKTDFDFSVPDYDDHSLTSSSRDSSRDPARDYFKALNKTNRRDNTGLVNNTNLLTITIDPSTCTDIDDAVSLRFLETTDELSDLLTKTLKALKEEPFKGEYSKLQTLLLLNGEIKDLQNFKETQTGSFHEIFIHIADCSAFISENSELDLAASIKGTSFYYETTTETSKRVDMLPSILSSNLISLRAGLLRRTLTVKVLVYEVSGRFLIIDYEFLNDLVVNKTKLSYETAEFILRGEYLCKACFNSEILNSGTPNSTNETNKFIETSIVEGTSIFEEPNTFEETDTCVECVQRKFKLPTTFTSKDVASALNFLMSFTRNLKINRGLSVLESLLGSFQKDTDFLEGLTPHGDSSSVLPNLSTDTHSLIEELMLLANQLAAIQIYTKSPQKTLLRIHKRTELNSSDFTSLPQEALKREVMKKMNQAKYRNTEHLLLSRDRSPVHFFENLINETPATNGTPAVRKNETPAVRKNGTPADERKKLKSSTVFKHQDSPFYHFGLNIPIYTHFTSPIRRYADLLVHRMILSSFQPSSNNKEDSNNESNNNESSNNKESKKEESNNNNEEKEESQQHRKLQKEVINNLNRQTMKGKILSRISKQIRFVTAGTKDHLAIIEKDYLAIIEKEEPKIFSLSFLGDRNTKPCFYTKVYLPAEEIEGYISTDEVQNFPAFSLLRVRVSDFKGNEVIFSLSLKGASSASEIINSEINNSEIINSKNKELQK